GPACCRTARSESTHSWVSTGSWSFRMPMHVLLVGCRSRKQRRTAMLPAQSRSVRRQPLYPEQFFQMRAHRHVEAHAGRQRLLEPAFVNRDDLAAARVLVESALVDLGELRVVLAKHERIVGVGEKIA